MVRIVCGGTKWCVSVVHHCCCHGYLVWGTLRRVLVTQQLHPLFLL